jgi:hypothetical protein
MQETDMKEQQTAHRIRRYLDEAPAFDGRVLARLKAARELALERQRVTAPAPVLVWAGDIGDIVTQPSRYLPQLALLAVLMLISAMAINQWRAGMRDAEIEEVDAAILTGDLPFNAYLDKGFDAWLNKN